MNCATEPSTLARHLQAAALAQPDPPADLWVRIAKAHARRRARRVRLRYAGGALAASLLCVLVVTGVRWHAGAVRGDESINWQARAQALELQLAALDRQGIANAPLDSGDVEDELAQVDGLLQTAYDHHAYTNELVPLWKRRSELLNALITAREQRLALMRI